MTLSIRPSVTTRPRWAPRPGHCMVPPPHCGLWMLLLCPAPPNAFPVLHPRAVPASVLAVPKTPPSPPHLPLRFCAWTSSSPSQVRVCPDPAGSLARF